MKSAAPFVDGHHMSTSRGDERGDGFGSAMNELELLVSEAFDEGVISEVIRPAAILPESNARAVLVEMALRDVNNGGFWHAQPNIWRRYDRPWDGPGGSEGSAELLGSIQVAYGTPTRYEITIYRATITRLGADHDWTVESLCDEALSFGGLDLASCPRADMSPPPKAFRFPEPRS
ncbi:MAG: hypothetical protein QOG53_3643 [Frankiales bacterium]|jgi:hypothetical protein|nr:hypothetical protein [Frankiales bacterium]